MSTVFNLGNIRHLTVPDEWQVEPMVRNERPGQIAQPYSLKSDSEITFAIYYRGREIPLVVAEDFLAVLDQPAHTLSEEEFETILIVLRNMAEPDFFKPEKMCTELIDGHMALVVEGLWLSTGLKNLGIFLNGNGVGTVVDELHYYAPQEKYAAHLSQVQQIIRSIKFDKERS